MFYHVKGVVLEDRILEDALVEVKNGVFGRILPYGEAPEGEEIIDAAQYLMTPGFVDTHIHGYLGKDIMDADPESVKVISEGIVRNGVTSFLATTLTASAEQLDAACRVVGETADQVKGSKVRGIFLEGPFFTEKHKGAQNPKYFGDPDLEKLKRWQELSGGRVRKIAIAAERDGVEEFTKKATEMGIVVAIGHSDASYEQAYQAVMAGASVFVHTYNGMSGLHHREPGVVGCALSTDDTYCELICDGHHVHPAAARVVMKAKGYDRTVLITDCMMAGGLQPGMYKLGEFDVKVEGGTARLESGSLAGSVLKLNQAVKNVVDWDIATKFEAVQMASLIPARSVGIDDVCGKVAEGYAADFNLLTDEMDVVQTYLDGELVR